MASVATSFRPSPTVRKPAVSEPGANSLRTPIVRQAFGADVVGSNLSPRAQLGYRVLADHVNRGRDPLRPYDGKVFLTDETFAAELGGVSKRQVQRIRSELLTGGWICLPKGDAGGRGNSTIWYHLHPDGRPCALAFSTPLKQRAAVANANLRRAATREQSGEHRVKDDKRDILSSHMHSKDDTSVILFTETELGNDDTTVILSSERMTEPNQKDDKNDAKDDKNGAVYKEELFQELIPEPKSTTTAPPQEFPADFAKLMDEELALDDGALRRLWQECRGIVSDATAEEVRDFFHRRALVVYRNRKLDNPTGLMLSTVRDWFPQRRVLERRDAIKKAAEEIATIQRQLAELSLTSSETDL